MNNCFENHLSMYIRHFSGLHYCPVLLLHGFLESGDIWVPWITTPDWSYESFVPDLPGHGSTKAWNKNDGFPAWSCYLMEQIEKVSKKNDAIHLIGHSMGGYLALEIARLFPQLIRKIVLLHSTPMPDSDQQIMHRKKQIVFVEKGKRRWLTKDVGPTMFAPGNRYRLEKTGKLLNQKAQKCTDDSLINALNAIMKRSDFTDIMHKKETDVLFVTGGKDPFMPLQHIETILSKFPGIHHKHLDNCGHASFLEEPEITRSLVLDFFSH